MLTIETFGEESDTDSEENDQVEDVLSVVLHKMFYPSHLGL